MTSAHGDLDLGHILHAAGLAESDILCVRHTYSSGGLGRDSTVEKILAFTRRQDLKPGKIPATPPRVWLIFIADGGQNSRFLTAYDNFGEIDEERTDIHRVFDLHESEVLSSLRSRLVVDWPGPINWTRPGSRAHECSVVEIAHPRKQAFPGFDRVIIDYATLQKLADVADPQWELWRTALAAVQGIYLIADSSTGQLYVGKADGLKGIYGRWSTYAQDGHGGNMAMKALSDLDPAHRQHFVFSILRVFGPDATTREIDDAERHYKQALLTTKYGLNRN